MKIETTVCKCGICGGLNECKIVDIRPVARIFWFLRIKFRANICQSCASRLMRSCIKDI